MVRKPGKAMLTHAIALCEGATAVISAFFLCVYVHVYVCVCASPRQHIHRNKFHCHFTRRDRESWVSSFSRFLCAIQQRKRNIQASQYVFPKAFTLAGVHAFCLQCFEEKSTLV